MNPTELTPLTPPVFHILLALSDQERHGYGIMQDVAAHTGAEMAQVFRDRCRDVARAGSGWSRFLMHSVMDAAAGAMRERLAWFSPAGLARAAGNQLRLVWQAGRNQAPRGPVAEWAFTILA